MKYYIYIFKNNKDDDKINDNNLKNYYTYFFYFHQIRFLNDYYQFLLKCTMKTSLNYIHLNL